MMRGRGLVSRIPDEILQKIRDHTDVAELIGRTVSLKRAGRNYKGLCPFHDEKTPSFNVNPDRGTFYCFGCQEGGDVFSFLMKTENLSFAESARSLAKDAGIEVPESFTRGEGGLAEKIYGANDVLLARYRKELDKPGCPGMAYLAKRGIDSESIEKFQIGWAPDAWDTAVQALRAERIPAETGERAGLLSRRERGGHYDRLRGRVVFPIQDVRGRTIGFGGRAVSEGQEPKYLNTPETPVFKKREAFYGFPMALDPIRRSERAVVVEGYFDQIALARAGVGAAVATCGTALTAEHARQLRRRTQRVVLLFDGDSAGERAMLRALEVLLPAGLRVHAALLPEGEDPDSLLERDGADALRTLVEKAPAALEVAIELAVAQGTETPAQKADVVGTVAPYLARVVSPIERTAYCDRLALAVGTDVRHVEAAVAAAGRGEDARESVPVAPRRSGPEDRNLRQLAQSLVEHPSLVTRVSRDEFGALVSDSPFAELVTVLIDAAAEARSVDFEELAQRLPDESRALLRSLAIGDASVEASTAERTVDDTLHWLREQRYKREQNEITRRLRDPRVNEEEKLRLLGERNRLLKERQQNLRRNPEATAGRHGGSRAAPA